MQEELIKAIATVGGTGGLMAALMFYFYRKDMEIHAKRQDQHIEVQSAMISQLVTVVQDNTRAMTALQETTSSLKSVVAEFAHDTRDRDVYLREHIMPALSRLSQQ